MEAQVRVVIIGAGFGGLGVALKLAAAGHDDFTVLERADAVGGTWQANTYPGAACDAPSHVYSYSFAPTTWSRRFAPGPEIRDYLEACVGRAGIEDHLRLGVGLDTARWDGTAWQLSLSDGSALTAEVLVGATGQLSVPSTPDLPGLDSFAGPVFHTARWRHDVDLTDLRVAVIGTGASAVQVVPAIAERVASVTVFQRSAGHVFPKPDAPYSPRLRALYARVPALPRLARLGIWSTFEVFGLWFWKWPGLMAAFERRHVRVLESVVSDPVTRAALTPTARMGCKRPMLSSDYFPSFNREDVHLVTDEVVGIGARAVHTHAHSHEVDAIVLATGFRTETFAASVDVTGVGGLTLQEAWAQGASAHLGMSVPGFPNFFLSYGPNTNLGSGSIIYMLEAQADHVVDAVRILSSGHRGALSLSRSAHDRFLAELAPRLRRTVWVEGCHNWYVDSHGRDTHNWPGFMTSYRRRVARVDLADYDGGH